MEIVRVLKVIEYSGERAAVEEQLKRSWVQGQVEKTQMVYSEGTRVPLGICTMRGAILGTFPELLETPEPVRVPDVPPLATEPEVMTPELQAASMEFANAVYHATRDNDPHDKTRHGVLSPDLLVAPATTPSVTISGGTYRVGDIVRYLEEVTEVSAVNPERGTLTLKDWKGAPLTDLAFLPGLRHATISEIAQYKR